MIGQLCCVVGLHSWAWRRRYMHGAFGEVAVCRNCDREWTQPPAWRRVLLSFVVGMGAILLGFMLTDYFSLPPA